MFTFVHGHVIADSIVTVHLIYNQLYVHPGGPGGGGGGYSTKLGYGAQHKLKIWTQMDLTASEKWGLKDLKRIFGKFLIGGLKDLNRVIDANC